MRLFLIGSGSYVARHVLAAAQQQGIAVHAVPHGTDLTGALTPDDHLLNCAIHPDYRSGPWRAEIDSDLKAAGMAARARCHFIMLSTRMVYDADVRWNAVETAPALGDETAYGRNKALSEQAVMATTDGRATIFRLSNVFGFEYGLEGRRPSFLTFLLTSLKQKNKIFFDMSPDTKRDFIPVETCAAGILRGLEDTSGIYNLGSGFALRCGDLAGWVMQGFGGGELIDDGSPARSEFYLNMNKWRDRFGPLVDPAMLQDYCTELGQRLRCAKS